MNPLLGSMALWPLEQLLNQLVRTDAHVEKTLARFDGKCLSVQTQSPSLDLTIQFDAGQVRLSGHSPMTLGLREDARVRGNADDLFALLTAEADSRALANNAVHIDGDAQFVQDLFHALQRLDLDWEDYLAPLLPDVVIHEAGKVQDQVSDFARQSKSRLARNLKDYLTEEIKLVPHPNRRKHFDNALDELKLQIDRASARLDRLDARLESLSN